MAYIDFKPTKSKGIQATFNSGSNTKVTTQSSNKTIDGNVTSVNQAQANLDSSFNHVTSAMIAENSFSGNSGIEQKFKYLKYAIDHETGNYLAILNTETNSILYLYSKLGEELSHVEIPNELPIKGKLTDRYLYLDFNGDLVWKYVADQIEYFSGISIYIDNNHKINLLYDESLFSITNDNKLTIRIDTLKQTFATNEQLAETQSQVDNLKITKQDNLDKQTIYSNKGTSSKVPQISTNEYGQVTKIEEIDINYPDTGVTEINAGYGLTGGKITKTGTIAVDTAEVALKKDFKISATDQQIEW